MPKKKYIPFEFIFDLLDTQEAIYTKSMFGSTAVYVGQKIVFMLRERDKFPEDNGVWIATLKEHQNTLKQIFPNMRSLALFGPGQTDWQVLPAGSDDFEESVANACTLVMSNDPRIGKIPKRKKIPNKK